MESIDFYQVSIFALQCLIIAFTVLLLFNHRKRFGLGPLFAALGLFQFIQVFLASTLYFKITEHIVISPGSSVIFSISLFALLLIYIKEGAEETRKLIYALVITNVLLCFLIISFRLNLEGAASYNPFQISTEFFYTNVIAILAGTFVLFIDSILIIFLFEFISKYISNLFARVILTMVAVLCFDTVFYVLGSFWYFDNVIEVLYSGLIGKTVVGIFYSIVFYCYLEFVEKEKDIPTYSSYKDVYNVLTYKQKFEIAEKAAKLGEARYATLTNLVPVGIFMTDTTGKTTFVNSKWSKITGVAKKDALGYGWIDAVHPEDKDSVLKGWEHNSDFESESYAEYRFLKKDGSIRWVLGQAMPEYNTNNELIGYIGTITDITEIKLYEQELNRLKDKAEESDRLKSAFLANMSHEIRTPMNGILGVAELLKEPKLSGEEHNLYLSLIEESGRRMLNIIRDIIDISRIESGQVKTNYSEVSVNDEMESLYHEFEPEASDKNIELFFTNDLNDQEATVKTDKEKLNTAVTNLIKNAIKYTEKGAITFGYQKLNGCLQFFIKDTGVGIPMDKQNAIFDRFVQAEMNGTYAMEGAGIGLSIAKAYVEMLNGKIWLESQKGVGSTFYFTIPYKQ